MRVLVVVLAMLGFALGTHAEGCEPIRKQGGIEGNITLGFMFHFFGPSGDSPVCNESTIPNPDHIQLVEAAIFAIRQAEGRFPDIKIGLEAHDTCYSTNVAVDRTVAFHRDRQVNGCGAKVKPGFVGSLDGNQGSVIAPIMTNSMTGTTSYAGADPGITGITRMISSSEDEAWVIARFLGTVGWSYVNLVIVGDTDGPLVTNFVSVAPQSKICISKNFTLKRRDDISRVYLDIIASELLTVVVIGEDSVLIKQFLVASSQHAANFQFMTSYGPFLEVADSLTENNSVVFGAVPEALYATNVDDGFDDYFRGLNLSTYDPEVNPWFRPFFEHKYSCIANETCDRSVFEHQESYRRHFLVTPVIDAIGAHLEALQAVCDVSDGNCDQEKYVVALGEVDFNSITSRRVAFSPNGSPEGRKFVILQSRNGVISQVSQSSDGVLDPLSEEVNVSPSVCEEGLCADPQCLKLRLNDDTDMAYVQGDLILAGFFPVREWNEEESRCGSLTANGALYVQAMIYAVNMINADETTLPGIRLGLDGFNTCGHPQRATDLALELSNKGSFDLSHTATRLSPDGTRLEHFFGVVGPQTLEEAEGVNKVVSTKKVPMIAYALDDPTISSYFYPYLGRTLPSSVAYIQGMLRYLSMNQITLFQVAYSAGFPGLQTARSYLRSGSWTGVCSSQEVEIPATDNATEWRNFLDALKKSPEAKALFLLTTDEDARRVLKNLDSMGLQGEYFIMAGPTWRPTKEDIDLFNSAQGSLVFNTPQRTYQGFKDYLPSINPVEANQTNPWMAEYWMTNFNCTFSSNQESTMCTGNEDLRDVHKMDDESIPRIIDAVYALAKTMDYLQKVECPGTDRVCPDLLQVDGDTFINSLRDMTLFQSINDDRPINFDFSYSLDYIYDVKQIQGTEIVKIGTLENFQVSPEPGTSIKFYGPDGAEIVDPEKNRIGCTTVTCMNSCERPDTDQVAESFRFTTPDLWIGGFFELSAPSEGGFECSNELILENVQLIEAFLYAVDMINADDSVLQQLILSGIAFDSCGSANRVTKEAGNLVFGTVDYRTLYATSKINVYGVIGGSNSDTTRALSEVISGPELNQISYAATASEFSDHLKYPYLLRTAPSDLYQARVFVDLLIKFGWSYVSVVYSDNIYGKDMLSLFTENLDPSTICVAMTLRVEQGSVQSDFAGIIDTLQSNSASRTVVLFTSDVDTRSVLRAAETKGVTDIQWVGSDTWGSREYVISNVNNTVAGAITIRFEKGNVTGFLDYISNIDPFRNDRNPWYKQFYSELNQCNLFGQPDIYNDYCPYPWFIEPSKVTNPLISNVINSVYAYAHGLDDALKELCPDGPNHHLCENLLKQPSRFHEFLQNVSFPKAEDQETTFAFDGSGDGQPKYDILNLIPDNGTMRYTKIGSWDKEGALVINDDPTFYKDGKIVDGATATRCSGRCSECQSDELLYGSLDGPVQIIGVAGVSGSRTCGEPTNSGILDAQAFLYAIDYVNGREDILPGIRLGGKVFDGCGVRAVRELSSYLDGVGEFANRSDTWQWPVGVVGAGTPSATELVRQTAEHYALPQVSYSFSSAVSDQPDSVIMTNQPVESYLQAVRETLERLGWPSISVIADQNDETQMLLYKTFLESTGDLCVQDSVMSQNISQAITILYDRQVILVFASAEVINTISEFPGDHRTFVFAGVADVRALTLTPSVVGSIVLTYSSGVPTFRTSLEGLDLQGPSTNPWLATYVGRWLQCGLGGVTGYDRICTGEDRLVPMRNELANAKNIIRGVLALATGLDSLQKSLCGDDVSGLCKELVAADLTSLARNGTFMDDDGESVQFLNGRQALPISIWNQQRTKLVKLTDWDGTLGEFAEQPVFYDNNGVAREIQSPCLTTTSPPTPSPPTTSATTTAVQTPSPPTTSATTTAVQTPSRATTTTPTTLEATSKPAAPVTSEQEFQRGEPMAEDYHQSVWFIVALILSGFGALLTLLSTVIYLCNRQTNYAQLHASLLIYTLAFAVLVMFLESVVFGIEVSTSVCALRRLLPGSAFYLAFTCVFLMAGRYYRILKKERRVSGLGAKYIDNKSQLLALLSVSCVGVCILLQWILYKEPGVTEMTRNEANVTNGSSVSLHCEHVDGEFPISFMFTYFLMFVTLILAFAAMKRSMVYFRKELQAMVACLVLSLLLGVAWVIVGIVAGSDPVVYVPITCFMGIAQAFILLIAIFPPIIKGLYKLDQDLFFDADTNSVVDGNEGFANPVSVYEDPSKLGEKEFPKEAAMDFESPM